MVKPILVPKTDIPATACTTVGALLPKMFCVITGEKANVYKGKQCIRKFQHWENGLLKLDKVQYAAKRNGLKLLKQVTEKGPLLIARHRTERTS